MSLSYISKIIKNTFEVPTNSEINNGNYYHWALFVKLLIPEAELEYNSIHAWVKIGDKYYDSESPNGEANSKDLKTNIFFNFNNTRENTSITKFKRYWGINLKT